MRAYETMYIIKTALEEEKIKASVEKFSSLIQNNGGELVKVDEWGKKRLAYEIDDLREGYYVLTKFKGEPSTITELERIYRISDEILRYIIVREEE